MQFTIAQIKNELASQLIEHESLKRPEGVPSGEPALDEFLESSGFPKGELSLIQAPLGMGCSSLFARSAQLTLQQKKYVAWMSGEFRFNPSGLAQLDVDYSRFFSVTSPKDEKLFLWTLQELLSSSIFDLIACDLGSLQLRHSQWQKILRATRQYKTALVFLNHTPISPPHSLFAVAIKIENQYLRIERALHRPTPHLIHRRFSHVKLRETIFFSTVAHAFSSRLTESALLANSEATNIKSNAS